MDIARARKLQAAAVEARAIDEKFRNEQVAQLRDSLKTTRENLAVASETKGKIARTDLPPKPLLQQRLEVGLVIDSEYLRLPHLLSPPRRQA